MAIFRHALYEHVVYIYLNVSPNLLDELPIHKPLIYCPHILQFERHDLIAEKPLTRDEWSFFLVSLIQLDLVVPEEGIHEAQQLMPGHRFDEEIDMWKRVAVLRAGFV